jgi:hypothetical protein
VAAITVAGNAAAKGGARRGDLSLTTSCEDPREIGNRSAQGIVFQAEESVDQPATMQRERKLSRRWRDDLAAALCLWYLVVKISDVDVEGFSHAHHHGRAQSVDALFVFLNLLERYPSFLPSSSWVIFIMMRRARSWSPKYLSIGPVLRVVPGRMTRLARFMLIDRPCLMSGFQPRCRYKSVRARFVGPDDRRAI